MHDSLPAFMSCIGEWNNETNHNIEIEPNTAPDGMPRFVWESEQETELTRLEGRELIDADAVGERFVEEFTALVSAYVTAHQRTDYKIQTARLVMVTKNSPQGGEVEVKSEWARQWVNDELSNSELFEAIAETWQVVDFPLHE